MEAVKNIVAHFIDKTPGEITSGTVINKSAVKGSILIHRMYAALAAEGFNVPNYINIQTFGDLLAIVNGQAIEADSSSAGILVSANGDDTLPQGANIGIDIENMSNMPEAVDYRDHPFYSQNFTQKEIAYCILKTDPRQSFLGLFCAKEAICKVDAITAQKMFNQIEITHIENGKPSFGDFILSISHTDNVAVAVAMKSAEQKVELTKEVQHNAVNPTDAPSALLQQKMALLLATVSLLISVAALILFLVKAHG